MTNNRLEKQEILLPKNITYVDIYNMLIPNAEIKNIDKDYVKKRAIKSLTEYGFGKKLQRLLQGTQEGQRLEEFFSTEEEVTCPPAFSRTVPKKDQEDFATNKSLLVPIEGSYGIVVISDNKHNPLKINPEIIYISQETTEEYKVFLDEILIEEIYNLEDRTIYLDKNMRI